MTPKRCLWLLAIYVGGWMSSQLRAQVYTNTVVHFHITAGAAVVGDMDVELFDSEKPVTVRNFLRYMESGAYSNIFLHRCVPGFVAQGGAYGSFNPFDGNLVDVPGLFTPFNFGKITNEFGVGPLRSNTYGTIAMAKQAGDPNSASSQFFFNLTNNAANLDHQNGGFTVFGRVIGSTNALENFNSRSYGNGLVNLNANYPGTFLGNTFTNLPVNYSGSAAPHYYDLLTVAITSTNAPDVLPPTVAITAPAANAKLRTNLVTAAGTAFDNLGVQSVTYILNTNAPMIATGTTNWSASLALEPGPNTLTVQSRDAGSNVSASVTRSFTYVVASVLSLNIVGNGTVSGVADGQSLQIGKSYTATAKPAVGQLFDGWSGGISSSAPVLKFVMQSNLVLTATFFPNPFAPVRGNYNGLFSEVDVQPVSAGFFNLAVTDTGTYSGSLLTGGRRYSVSGHFNSSGQAMNTITRLGMSALTVAWQLDLTNGTDQVTGQVSDGVWVSPLLGNRAVFSIPTNVFASAGNYTLIIPGHTNAAIGPGGDGFGLVKVDGNGVITLKGALADRTKIAQKKVWLSKNGEWPFFASLYRGQGVVQGWLTFTNRAADDLNGAGNWVKTSAAVAPLYAGGFTNLPMIQGAAYTLTPGGKVLNVSNGVVVLRGGNLTQNWTNTVTLGADNKVVNTSGNTLKLAITTKTGAFKGSFVEPGTGRKVSFVGALQQKQNAGFGYFTGTTESGEVRFEAAP